MKRSASHMGLLLGLVLLASVGCRAQETTAPSLREEFRRSVIAGRMPCPLNPKVVQDGEVGSVRVERVRFTPEEGQDAVAAIYRPKGEGKYPVIILQHFLGGTKDTLAFLPLFNSLAQKGYLVAAIDGRYRGERQNGKSLEAAVLSALRTGKEHPFLLDGTYDILRLLDYLVTRPDVDASRIGMTGFSEGGIVTWMSAAADDRIKVAVPIIGITTFGDTFKDGQELTGASAMLFGPVLQEYAKDLGETQVNGKVMRSAWSKLVPGMLDRFDAPNILPLIAPRPLLVMNHEKDELFPVEGAKKVQTALKARYEELKAPDRFDFRIAPGLKHAEFNFGEVASMVAWFDQWLKNPPAAAAQ